MALINHAKREINAKIVYFGREGAGKRESLQYIYDRIKPALRGELKSPPASGDSLLFFDFSPFETPVFGDYRLRFHLYTLTGPVANPAAWKMTLKGADGLIIVADAGPEQVVASGEAILLLRDFLSAYGVGLNDTPCVVQLVGNSLSGGVTAETAAAAVGLSGVQAVISEPSRGTGVLDALSRLSREIMTRIGQDDALKAGGGEIVAEAEVEPVSPEVAPSVAHEEVALSTPLDRNEINDALSVNVSGKVECSNGLIKIPLELSVSGTTRRLIVSIAIEEVATS